MVRRGHHDAHRAEDLGELVLSEEVAALGL
jgi:hypothetical protein